MFKERATYTDEVRFALTLGILYYCAMAQFPRRVSKNIIEQAGGMCHNCGKQVGAENLIAAHTSHTRGKGYKNAENGTAVCICCEAEYHLRHADSPELIGLSQKQNDQTILGYMGRLTQEERGAVIANHTTQWYAVKKRRG